MESLKIGNYFCSPRVLTHEEKFVFNGLPGTDATISVSGQNSTDAV